MGDFLSLTAGDVEVLPLEEVEAVLAAWVAAKRTELPEALARSTSKPHAKLAKKALYQLKSQGLELREPPLEAKTEAPPSQAPEDSGLPAVLSAVVGTGERALLFAVPQRGGGIEVFQGIVSDEFGLVQFGSGTTNRNTYRQRLKQLEQDTQIRVLQVSLSRMKLELGRALTLNERSKTRPPDDSMDALRRLGVEPADPDFPLPPVEPTDAEDAQQAAALHQQPELAQWLPSEAQLTLLSQHADALKHSPLELTPAQKAEQLRRRAVASAHEFLTEPMRKLYARRLWTCAEIFEASGRAQPAQIARAEARRLFHTSEPSAFVDQLFVKVVEQGLLQASAPQRGFPGNEGH